MLRDEDTGLLFEQAKAAARQRRTGVNKAAEDNERREFLSAALEAPQALGGACEPTSEQTWEQRQAELEAKLDAAIRRDFKVFLTLVWQHLGLGTPSAVQLSIADYLQSGPRLSVVMAFRGCGKSWITAAFALWTLYCDRQAKVMVVSGSMKRATQFTTFCLALIHDMPLLKHMAPSRMQRQSATAFDVAGARPAQSTSFSAFGVTGQLVGQRATLIIPDDVETNVNSFTVMMREKLLDSIREFGAILVPGGTIKFLGTPQNNDSIYNKLPKAGYAIRIWPLCFPNDKRTDKSKPSELERYGDSLSPWVRNRLAGNIGKSVWPERFSAEFVEEKKLQWGTSGFALQYMLDTSLADTDRYPLKLNNLIVMALPMDKGPEDVTWGRGEDLVLTGLPVMGFPNDRFHKPATISQNYAPWQKIVGIIDPSDEGDDEAALTIWGLLNARIALLSSSGWVNGSSPATMRAIAAELVKYRASHCRIESNYGGSMFGQLLKPHLIEAWDIWNKAHPKEHGGTQLEDERANRVQKELRIIADAEPATQAHRIIVNLEVIEKDYAEVLARTDAGEFSNRYSLFYQYCNLTRERHSLKHDDRLDAFAGGIAYFRDILGVNPQTLAERGEDERLEEELRKLGHDEDEVQGVKSFTHDPLSPRHTTGRRRSGW